MFCCVFPCCCCGCNCCCCCLVLLLLSRVCACPSSVPKRRSMTRRDLDLGLCLGSRVLKSQLQQLKYIIYIPFSLALLLLSPLVVSFFALCYFYCFRIVFSALCSAAGNFVFVAIKLIYCNCFYLINTRAHTHIDLWVKCCFCDIYTLVLRTKTNL